MQYISTYPYIIICYNIIIKQFLGNHGKALVIIYSTSFWNLKRIYPSMTIKRSSTSSISECYFIEKNPQFFLFPFLVLPNFRSRFYNSMETLKMFPIFLVKYQSFFCKIAILFWYEQCGHLGDTVINISDQHKTRMKAFKHTHKGT